MGGGSHKDANIRASIDNLDLGDEFVPPTDQFAVQNGANNTLSGEVTIN